MKIKLLILLFFIIGISTIQAQYKGFTKTSSEEEILKGLKVKHRRVSSDALDVLTQKAVTSPITNSQILSAINECTTPQTDYQIYERAKIFLVLNGNSPMKEKKEILKANAQTKNYLLKKLSIMNLGKIGTSDDIPFLESKLTDKSMGADDVDEPPFLPVDEAALVAIDQIKVRNLPSEKQVDFLIKRFTENPIVIARRNMMADFGDLVTPPLTQKLVELFKRDFLQNTKNLVFGKGINDKDPMPDISFLLDEMNISNSEATKLLIPFINHQQNLVRYEAICALKGIGTKEAIPILEKITKGENNSNYTFWYHAQEAISRIRARNK